MITEGDYYILVTWISQANRAIFKNNAVHDKLYIYVHGVYSLAC